MSLVLSLPSLLDASIFLPTHGDTFLVHRLWLWVRQIIESFHVVPQVAIGGACRLIVQHERSLTDGKGQDQSAEVDGKSVRAVWR